MNNVVLSKMVFISFLLLIKENTMFSGVKMELPEEGAITVVQQAFRIEDPQAVGCVWLFEHQVLELWMKI